jgi:hypothetical protein
LRGQCRSNTNFERLGATMSTSPHHRSNPIASGATNDDRSGEVSRRAMLAGAVATTAAVAVGAGDMPAYAHTADPNSRQDMMAFLVLSAALTGIHVANLAPEFSQNDPNDNSKKLPILDAGPASTPSTSRTTTSSGSMPATPRRSNACCRLPGTTASRRRTLSTA